MTIKVYKAMDVHMEHMAWLLYGAAGSGKTTLAASFPSPIIMLNMVPANEKQTVRGHPNIDILDIDSAQDMNDAIVFVEKNATKYKTVLVDNLTTLLEILTRTPSGRMSLEAWMPIGNAIMGMVDRFRKLPLEAVYTAGLTSAADEVGSGKHGGPALFRWLEQRLPHKMDANIYVESSADVRGLVTFRAHLGGFGPMKGRIRGSLPGGVVENPSYVEIMKRVSEPLFNGTADPASSMLGVVEDPVASPESKAPRPGSGT